ncbi:hypothetical protein SG34_023940 [Thalassomonas viridans]|uniref:Uncharacterized protein n=1 Tax=Thalassomonas viridans TaxID=137584 RepID=A0AAE9Z351_9GAMM|nr:hypothetical protein [Thalassomonas viridans]WDE04358.1 hypothetical protein SG34_023940 [Thalassomonas viridans]
MVTVFDGNEVGYLIWVENHKENGYIVNIDNPNNIKDYPKVHVAKRSCVTSPKRMNYTTNQYKKVCSTDLSKLELWSKETYKKELVFCRVCFK